MNNPHSNTSEGITDVLPEIGKGATVEPPEQIATGVRRGVADARRRVDRVLRRASLPLLRFSLGVVFIWFGALKVAGVTPVKELVAETMPLLDAGWFVPALGWFEIVLGVALMVGYRLGWVCAAMVAHLGGTFFTVVMEPNAMFRHGNPFMLTMEGEFVAKNLVLITAALVIAAWPRQPAAAQAQPAHPPVAAV